MTIHAELLIDLLQAKYSEDPKGFREYLPGVAELLPEPPLRRANRRSTFGLTERELSYHRAGLLEALGRLDEGAITAEEAVKGLQHCAALIKDDNLPYSGELADGVDENLPHEMGHEVLKSLVRAALGKSPGSYKSKLAHRSLRRGERQVQDHQPSLPGNDRLSPHGELLGKDGLFLVVHGDKEEVRRRGLAIDMLKGKARSPYRFRIRTKSSGDIRWIVGGMAPFEYEGRRAAIGYYMDITAQVRLRSALRDCVRRSKQMRTQLLALSTSPSEGEETARAGTSDGIDRASSGGRPHGSSTKRGPGP